MTAFDTEPLQARAEADIADAAHRAVAAYLEAARQAVLGTEPDPDATTADAGPADLPPDMSRWPSDGFWMQLVRRFLGPVIEAAFNLAFDAAARSDVLKRAAYRQTFMDTVFDRLSENLWTNGTFDRIRGDLAAGLDAGESVPQLRERIAAELDVSKHAYVADRIARTESHAATEGGTWSSMQAYTDATGEPMFKRWIATADARTRPDHLAASGQTVPIAQPFNVGGADLMYPGDPNGPASAVVNCRCSQLLGTAEELDALPASPADTQGSGTMPELEDPTYPYADTPADTQRDRWRGVLAPLDVRGDYRVLVSPSDGVALTADHMWLSWQEKSADGHDGKVAVGTIDQVWIEDGMLWGEGRFDLADPVAAEVARKVGEGFAGTVSIDANDMIAATVEPAVYDADDNPVDVSGADAFELESKLEDGTWRVLERWSDWRLGGATLVQDPAFHTGRKGKQAAFIRIVDDEDDTAVVAAVVGEADLPLADRDREWDGTEAKRRLAEAGRLSEGTFWREDDADADSDVQSDYSLPFADIIDGELRAVPRGVFTVAGVLEGSMGGVDLPEDVQDQIRSRVNSYYAKMRDEFDDPDIVPPWEGDDTGGEASSEEEASMTAITAAAGISPETTTWAERTAATAPVEPPAAWFTDPKLTGPTKVRVTDEGRVYGHVACWNTDHISFPGQSVRPPRSRTGYAQFHRHRVRTADGGVVHAGTIVMGTGHADIKVSSGPAMAHYDDTGYGVADVVCGEDAHGIWFSGALKPGVSPLQVLTLDRYSVSGDWRNNELVGVCVVNVPGFPISAAETGLALAACGAPVETVRVRQRVDADGPCALVACGVLAPERPTPQTAADRAVAAMERTAKELENKFEALADRVYAAGVMGARDERDIHARARQMVADDVEAARAVVEAD